MYALGRVHGELAFHAGHLLNLVIPHAGSVDEDLAAHSGFAPSGGIADLGTYDAAAAVLVKANDLGIGADIGAVLGGGTQHGHGMAGVIHEGVVVANATHNGIILQARGHLQHALTGQVLLHWHALRSAHEVIERKSTEHHDALPYMVGQREDELQRLHQVRRQGGHVELALLEGLCHEAEVKHCQVAQATVEHLGGAGRGTCGEVACLNDGGLQTAGGGIRCRTGAYGTATDNDYVVVLICVPVP